MRGLQMVKTLAATDNSPAQLLIRLALGVVIFPHGAQKVFGWFGGPGYGATVTAFSALGFPLWAILLLMVTEAGGSLLLVLGVFTRIWALAIGAAIAICLKMNHLQYGFFMNWLGQQQGEGYEYHILILGIALALVFRGGGMLSLDRVLARDRRRGGIVL
jgi:putative oxidoreductase